MRHTTPPSTDDIIQMAEHALDAIPAELRALVRGVAIMVEDVADDETLAAMGLDNPWDLTGLYSGTPLTQKSVLDVALQPDTIFLYREAILLEWIETGEELFRLVRIVLIHEIGHHFGLSDADIERLEQDE